MSERIVKRPGDQSKRLQANRALAEVGTLKNEYKACKDRADKLNDALELERVKLSRATSSLEDAREKLSDAQEEIDCVPLPEGAQPKERIQRRDQLKLVSTSFSISYDDGYVLMSTDELDP
jgi:septal ring factor EnvC (AmiA/AmiB activator)